MSGPARRTAFTQRVGGLLQQQRRRQGLTQADLAERADLSLKYLGEVERGEANVTIQALERIAGVLGWDPWTLFAQRQQPVAQGVHHVLMTELNRGHEWLQTFREWVTALDPVRREARSQADRPPALAAPVSRRRGRPPRQEGHHAPHA